MSTRTIACSHVLVHDKIVRNGVLEFENEILKSFNCEVSGLDTKPKTEYYNGVLVPSFVNSHCHLELSYFKGIIPQGVGLVEFIKYVIKHRNDFSIPQRVAAAKIMDKVMWHDGVGAVGDISNNGFTMELKSQSKIYYHTFAEYFGLTGDPSDMTTEVTEAAKEWGVISTPSAHSTYLVGDEQFKETNKQPIASIHFMETKLELDFFNKKGDMYDFVVPGSGNPNFLHYGGHIERLISSLRPDLKLLLVHASQMSQKDIEKVLEYFSDVTFVLCPLSNYYIGRDVPPAQLLHDMGAKVALGTDSLASNTVYSMVAEVSHVMATNPKLKLEDVLVWATRNGAKGLGIENKLGNFTEQTKCGAVLIEGIDLRNLNLTQNSSSRRII